MSYQVIARKWRPQTFDEVTGQEPITRTLRNAIEHERLHHAYLFSGARGVGKTTTARLLAKALNCHKATHPTPTPCINGDPTECPSCKEIAEGRSMDVQEIDAASNTGVDNVRDAIIGNVAISPARDRYKVFIIDEVHMLSGAAFNALLKTLEEPPPRVVFIMATTESHKLPDTILSRCQQFEFRTIATARIAERLRLIADAEKVKIADDALKEIARAGEGSMRDAQSAFDQVISFSGPKIVAADVEAALGIAGAQMLARIVQGISDNNPAEALAVVDDLVMRGHDLRNFCRDLLAHLRDLLVAKVSGDASELLESSATEHRELVRQANAFNESDLVRFFHSLTETENNLRTAAHPRYQLEVGLVKLMEMRRLHGLDQLIERISALEESLRKGAAPVTPAAGGAPPAPTGGQKTNMGGKSSSFQGASQSRVVGPNAASSKEIPAAATSSQSPQDEPPFAGVGGTTRAASTNAPGLTLVSAPNAPQESQAQATVALQSQADVEHDSEEFHLDQEDSVGPAAPVVAASPAQGSFVERVKAALEERRRMFLVTSLDGARRVAVEDEELCIEFAPDMKHLRDTLAKPESVKILRDVCRELAGRDMGVRISIKEQGTAANDAPPSQAEEARLEKQRLREMAEQHPAVQQMLKTFRGEIVDVKRIDTEG
ncbi:MAG TPA: DNA polymerase III subunit gamma/tau [Pyrinomonadaceae bacterium]|jgi:DNA polymerase-3 subunit gamma/tau|nr:DNA polymerase III subunit gamma/tau [Pyrinomonadaceae bacterium]